MYKLSDIIACIHTVTRAAIVVISIAIVASTCGVFMVSTVMRSPWIVGALRDGRLISITSHIVQENRTSTRTTAIDV